MINTSELLTREQRVILLTSRLTFSEENEIDLARILRVKLDWFLIFRIALKNKVLSLLWTNLKNRYYEDVVPSKLRLVLDYYSIGVKKRNVILLSEFEEVAHELNSRCISFVPIKGSQLLPDLYKDYSLRTMGDLDFLVRRSDGKQIRQVMNSIGYLEGEYDLKSKSIKKLDRRRQLFYQIGMHQLVEYLKLVENEYINVIPIDFNLFLDFDSDPMIVDSLISRSIKKEGADYRCLNPADFLIHLCCNIYKDAFNATMIIKRNDLRLINYCDVREYVLQIMDSSQIAEALQFANENNFQKPVYFVFHCLNLLYHDGYEKHIMETLDIKDLSFMDSFGEKEFGYAITWKKGFLQRLFSDNNKDELREIPMAAKILGYQNDNTYGINATE